MGRVLDVELFLQAPARLEETIAAVLGDRSALALALRFQGAAALAPPRPAALRPGHEVPGSSSTLTGSSSSSPAASDACPRSRSSRALASRSALRRPSRV